MTGSGSHVDGDQIVAILARDLARRGRLPGDLVVVTSMSNLGFHPAMQTLDLQTRRHGRRRPLRARGDARARAELVASSPAT